MRRTIAAGVLVCAWAPWIAAQVVDRPGDAAMAAEAGAEMVLEVMIDALGKAQAQGAPVAEAVPGLDARACDDVWITNLLLAAGPPDTKGEQRVEATFALVAGAGSKLVDVKLELRQDGRWLGRREIQRITVKEGRTVRKRSAFFVRTGGSLDTNRPVSLTITLTVKDK